MPLLEDQFSCHFLKEFVTKTPGTAVFDSWHEASPLPPPSHLPPVSLSASVLTPSPISVPSPVFPFSPRWQRVGGAAVQGGVSQDVGCKSYPSFFYLVIKSGFYSRPSQTCVRPRLNWKHSASDTCNHCPHPFSPLTRPACETRGNRWSLRSHYVSTAFGRLQRN